MSKDKEILGTETQGPLAGVDSLGNQKRQTIFRLRKVERPRYTVISNEPLDDPRLSWGAKGLLSYMLSKPDDWEFRRGEILKDSSDKEPTLRKLIKELKECGYLKIECHRDAQGHIFEWITYVYERPFEDHEPVDNFSKPPVNTGTFTRCYFTTCGETTDKQILRQTNTDLKNKTNNNKLKRDDDYPQFINRVVDKSDNSSFTGKSKPNKIPQDGILEQLAKIGFSAIACETILVKYGNARAMEVLNYVKNKENSISDAKAYAKYLLEQKIEISPASVRSRRYPTAEETVIPKLRTEIPPESVELGVKALNEIRNKLSNGRDG